MSDEFELRTDLYCHNCDKTFFAELDLLLTGNHVIECPHCGHEHCRVIMNGKVTGDRWDSRFGGDKCLPRRVWKHNSLKIVTSSATEIMRQRWIKTLT